MPKYYSQIGDRTELDRKAGAALVVPLGFHELSSSLVSTCSYLQSLIQQTIYITHGAELAAAGTALKQFPSPKARIEFLCSFPYSEKDEVVFKVFNYARSLFSDIYALRNILSHENWSSSDQFRDRVLFTSLDEEARLLMVSGRVWHHAESTPLEVYNATVRYIRSVKIVSESDLQVALRDADLCAWMLMHIGNVLNEKDSAKKEEARKAFLLFQGTAHLFDNISLDTTEIRYQSSRSKTIG